MHGQMSDGQLFLAEHDPSYSRQIYETIGATFSRTEDVIPSKWRELIVIATLAAHGSWDAVRLHVRRALQNEISPEELLRTFQIAAVPAGLPVAVGGAEALKNELDRLGRPFR